MTIAKVADRGVRNSTSTGTATITLTNPTLIAVGSYLIARVAVDNSGASGARPGLAVTDSRSHTWTAPAGALQDPGAASAGSACYLCYVKVVTAFQAADTVTFTWTTGTPVSAIVIEEWSGIAAQTPVAVAQNTGNNVSSTAQPSIARTPTAAGQLMYVACANEGQVGDWGTQDSDSTNGTWSDVTKDTANTGTHDTSMSVYGGYKIVNASGAQTWNNTLGVTGDWSACAIVFAPEVDLPTLTHRRQHPVLRGYSDDNDPYTLPRARADFSAAALAYIPAAADDILPAAAVHLVDAVDDVPAFRQRRKVNPSLYETPPVVRTAKAFVAVYARAAGYQWTPLLPARARIIGAEPAYLLKSRRLNPALFPTTGAASSTAAAPTVVYARATGTHKTTRTATVPLTVYARATGTKKVVAPQKTPAAVIVRATGAAVSSGTKQGIAKAVLTVISRAVGTHKATRAALASTAVTVPPTGAHKTSRPVTARFAVIVRATGVPGGAGTKQGVAKAFVVVTCRATGTHKATARTASIPAAVIARPTGKHKATRAARGDLTVIAGPTGKHKTTRAARGYCVVYARTAGGPPPTVILGTGTIIMTGPGGTLTMTGPRAALTMTGPDGEVTIEP